VDSAFVDTMMEYGIPIYENATPDGEVHALHRREDTLAKRPPAMAGSDKNQRKTSKSASNNEKVLEAKAVPQISIPFHFIL